MVLQEDTICIEYEARERNLRVVKVNLRGHYQNA
jgi:hypothetical protein